MYVKYISLNEYNEELKQHLEREKKALEKYRESGEKHLEKIAEMSVLELEEQLENRGLNINFMVRLINSYLTDKEKEELLNLVDRQLHDETETAEALYQEVSRLRNRVEELEKSEEMLQVYQRNAPFYLERAR